MQNQKPLILKPLCMHTYMHGLAVYVKEGLPFARDLSSENSEDSYLCSTGFISFGVVVLFPFID